MRDHIFPSYVRAKNKNTGRPSVTDEAFGLLVIYNEEHVWKEQEVTKQNGRKGTMIKSKEAILFRKEQEQTGMVRCWFESIQFAVSSSKMVSVEKQIKQ